VVSVSFAVRREDEQKNDVRARERELARVAKSMPKTSGAGSPDNYTIRTGSYPQIIHAESKDVTGGRITCSEFVDVNGKRHEDWIPAIRLS